METKTSNLPNMGVVDAPQMMPHDEGSPDVMEVQPLPVASTLRKLAIGEKAVFPIEQRSTVLNTLSRFRSDYIRQGWDAEPTTNKQNFTVVVTRIS